MRKKKIINQLEDDICDLEREIEELKAENKEKEKSNLEELLKDYQYAILVKDYDTKVWNDGRFEKGVREINFSHRAGINVPEIEIIK